MRVVVALLLVRGSVVTASRAVEAFSVVGCTVSVAFEAALSSVVISTVVPSVAKELTPRESSLISPFVAKPSSFERSVVATVVGAFNVDRMSPSVTSALMFDEEAVGASVEAC